MSPTNNELDEILLTLEREADLEREAATPEVKPLSTDSFYAYMPDHSYIFIPTRQPWPACSVDARLPPIPIEGNKSMKASLWIDQNRPVEQMTWAPGMPMLVKNKLVADGGWIDSPHNCLNLYRPPTLKHGDPTRAGPWVQHIEKVYPDDAQHIIKWLAQRVQTPDEKINHALVLGGKVGIGKDTILEAVKRAIGPWNFQEASPQQVLGRFNGFIKSVMLRINEAKDLGEFDRHAFYDHMKVYTAAPPDVIRVDEKNIREHSVVNCCGVIITTNYKAGGIYLQADDRRHYVAWSNLSQEDFTPAYFDGLWSWYATGGDGHVAAYLASLDLSDFNPKAPPLKTQAFWEMVNSNRPPENAAIADAIEALETPKVFTLEELTLRMNDSNVVELMKDRRFRRQIPHRLEECGYVPVHNRLAKDGLWKVRGKRRAIYAREELAPTEQIAAASAMARG